LAKFSKFKKKIKNPAFIHRSNTASKKLLKNPSGESLKIFLKIIEMEKTKKVF
jgi:hypothetical protein